MAESLRQELEVRGTVLMSPPGLVRNCGSQFATWAASQPKEGRYACTHPCNHCRLDKSWHLTFCRFGLIVALLVEPHHQLQFYLGVVQEQLHLQPRSNFSPVQVDQASSLTSSSSLSSSSSSANRKRCPRLCFL